MPPPSDADAVFFLPAKHALVRPSTITVLAAQPDDGAALVLTPTFRGAPGVPFLLRAESARSVLARSDGASLADTLHGLPTQSVPVADARILFAVRDGTEPEAKRLLTRQDVPTPQEALTLLELNGAGAALLGHVRGVAEVAMAMGRALNNRGAGVDLDILESATLLHDVAKGRPKHATAGADLLRSLGFPRLAAIVAVHQDIPPEDAPRITERELVYLADKYVGGATRMSLRQRFGAKLADRAGDPTACAALRRRLDNALAMQARVEAAAGKNIPKILGVPA